MTINQKSVEPDSMCCSKDGDVRAFFVDQGVVPDCPPALLELIAREADLRRFARAHNSRLAMTAVLTPPGACTNPCDVHNSRLRFSVLRGATCFLANGLESRREIEDVARSVGTGLPSYTVRLVKALGDILQESNPLVRGYVKIRDIIKDTRSAVETPIQNHLPYVFALKLDAGHHNGRFYDECMNVLSAEYEPLAFPLLFPFGQPGWSPELKKKYVLFLARRIAERVVQAAAAASVAAAASWLPQSQRTSRLQRPS
ncbi:hypothetical protein H9P43_002397 [Blastocladiella emersonii ATCC 22665]|nr:hypothetical protein H9P43_002397 [Blastocladiella emersonii ATCC 22665]